MISLFHAHHSNSIATDNYRILDGLLIFKLLNATHH